MDSSEHKKRRPEPELSSPVTVVREMFDAFGRGDVSGILETVDPESRWTYIGANPEPRRASMEGHEGVRRFFQRILDRLDMSSFEPREFVVQGPTVVVFGSESGVVRKTREPFRNEWVQKYVVRNGKITEMEEFNISVEEPDRPRGSEMPGAPGREDRIDDALRMTFPASDPPSWPSHSEAGSRGDGPRQGSEMIAVKGATGHLGRLVGKTCWSEGSGRVRADFAAAAAEVLTGRGHGSRVYELGGEGAFTLSELAETILPAERSPGRPGPARGEVRGGAHRRSTARAVRPRSGRFGPRDRPWRAVHGERRSPAPHRSVPHVAGPGRTRCARTEQRR